MSTVLPFEPTQLHHAYLIEGDRQSALSALMDLFHKAGIATEGNPDYSLLLTDTLKIDDARALRVSQTLTSAQGSEKYFVISCASMTGEAQNTLLKTLEEPTKGTHFFLLLPTRSLLMPTVLSRLSIYTLPATPSDDVQESGLAFLALDVADRLKYVEKILRAKTEEKELTRERTRTLLDGLSLAIVQTWGVNAKTALCLRDIQDAKRETYRTAPSLKLLLEHLALTLPLP